MIQPGVYKATVGDYAIRAVKTGANKGLPAPTIQFLVLDDTKVEKIYWQGSFAEGRPREISLEALANCGLTVDKIPALAEGPRGGALDLTIEVQVTIEHEIGEKDGKPYPRVKWVNKVGGKGFQETMDKDNFQFFVGSLGLQGSFLEIARKVGIDVEPKKPALPVVDNIPF